MEQFTYIYKQGALCGTARAARTIGPRPPAGYGYPEKTAGVPCRRRACPRSSHPARPPSAESPRLPQPGRTPAPFRSNTGKDAAGCAASYLGIPAAPHHRLQTAERAAAPTGLPDPESGRSTARRQKTANGAGAMEATEAADRLRTRAPRPGIGSLHGEETENGKRCGGNGSNRGSRSAAHPGTPTRNRAVPRRGNRKQQTERRQWQQRSSEGGRSVVCIRNGVKIMPPAEKRSFFLIFAP